MTQTEQTTPTNKRVSGKLFLLAFVIVGLVIAARHFDAREKLQLALTWMDGLGFWGPLVFILAYIVATVFLLPGSVLTLGAGAVFGLFKGGLYVSIGSTIGATAAFLVGRYFARDWVARKIEGNEKFTAVDEAVAEEGWKIVGLLRLSPMFPFNLLNYGFAVTRVSLRDYFLASWIGMIPGTIMWVYIGYLANVAASDGDATSKTLKIIGFVATVILTITATRIATKALDRKLAEASARKSHS